MCLEIQPLPLVALDVVVEGHLRPPLLEAAQVEGEEIVWSGEERL